MIFKDIKSGYPVYILDRGKMEAVTGKVVGVSGPRYMQMQGIQQTQIVVDITIETDGVSQQYAIPESLSVTYSGDLVLSTDREGILREVEALKGKSVDIVNSIDKHKATIESCDRILQEWNPAFAERKKQEERITGLESKVDKISDMLSSFLSEFKK